MSQKQELTRIVISVIIAAVFLLGILWLLRIWIRPDNEVESKVAGLVDSSSTPDSSSTSNGTFKEVQKVPNGKFSYGGSTTWATIRGKVDPVMQGAWPQFELLYTQDTVKAPGSGTGIEMLLNDQLAFSQSSRPIKAQEYKQAQAKGFNLKEIAVAIDGIAIAVNPNLNIAGLTVAQLKDIYTGKLTNWNQVGGPKLPITPYSRRLQEGGTVADFAETVLKDEKFGANVKFIPTTTEALREIKKNRGGIYYGSAPEVVPQCGIKPLAIGHKSDELVPPYQEPLVNYPQCLAQPNQVNTDFIRSGKYPLAHQLFVIVNKNGQKVEQAGEAYANLLLTNQGQNLLEKAGFVRIQ